MNRMMRTGMIAVLSISGYAMAAEMPPLAVKNKCISCHAIDRKVVGPAWQDVARKYKGDKTAATRLAAKVKKGGSGSWGSVAMPPQPASDADVKQLIKFILSLTNERDFPVPKGR